MTEKGLIKIENEAEVYELLVDDCKAILTEGFFRSREELIDTYKQLGERITTDKLYIKYGGKKSIKGEVSESNKFITKLAKDIGRGLRVLYYAIQFYSALTLPDDRFCTAVQKLGKNASWNKIRALLPVPKVKTPPLPKGKWQVIYADPPWDVKAGPGWGEGGESRDLNYLPMTLETIKKLPVKELADKNAHLYLWVVNKYIQQSYDVVRAWGFEPSCLITWVKPPHGIGLGGTFVQTTEHLLFCRKGTLEAKKRIDTTWFQYPREEHSKKPEGFRKTIEEVSPGKRIELFARRKVEGWDVWG